MTYLRFNNPEMSRGFVNPVFRNELLGKHADCYSNNDPRYEVSEKDGSYELVMAVPGLTKDDLNIIVEEGVLSVKTVQKENVDANVDFLNLNFEKQFRLSKKINQEAIKAHTEYGVLSISLPKVEEEVKKPARVIEVA